MLPFLFHLVFLLSLSSADSTASNNLSERRNPSAIIIGVRKSGTRALLEFLRLNPQVRAAGPEVHFFDRHYDRGFDWYRRQMPKTRVDQISIEKSPSYFVTKTAPQRIRDFDPNVKLIIVVRDPVTRLISDYTQMKSKRQGMGTFEEMAFMPSRNHSDTHRPHSEVNKSWGAVRIGIYWRYVKRWLQYFSLSQMHFVNGDRLVTQPAAQVQAVERFLGLHSVVTPALFQWSTEKRFPCIRRPNNTVHCLGKTKGRTHPYVSPEAIQRLRTFYQPENEIFYKMVKQNFGW